MKNFEILEFNKANELVNNSFAETLEEAREISKAVKTKYNRIIILNLKKNIQQF